MNDRFKEIQKFNKKLEPIVHRMIPFSLPNIEINILQFLDFIHTDTKTWLNDFSKFMVNYETATRLHQHNFYEFSYVQEGAIEYFTEDIKIPLKKGELFFMPPGIKHSWNATTNPLLLTSFHLKIQAVNHQGTMTLQKINRSIEKHGFCFPGDDSLDLILSEIHHKLKYFNEITHYTLQNLLTTFVIHTFETFLCHPFKSGIFDHEHNDDRNVQIAQQIKELIDDNIQVNVSIQDIASHFSYSFRQLNRIFSSIHGISIGKFIIENKLNIAKRRLMTSSCLVKTIAMELGYHDLAYFCRLFKKNTGETPESYRIKSLKKNL